jgi:hypothetical protein
VSRAAAEYCAHPLLVGGIEHKIKRRLEPARYFSRIRRQREIGRDQADDRRHLVASYGSVGVSFTQYSHFGRVEAKFLTGFTKRSLARRFAWVDPSARKGDLASVRPQIVATHGEN